MKKLLILLALLLTGADYPIVAVRAPRRGDTTPTLWQEVFHPINGEPGSHLVLIKPDGTEEVLVSAGEKGCILDPCPSLDGKFVYYAHVLDITSPGRNNNQVHDTPLASSGADIYRIELATKTITRLTHQEFTPNTSHFNWSKSPIKSEPAGTVYSGYGVYNTGPCPLPGGRIMFTSSRDHYAAPKGGWSFPTMQLFVMDADGKNVECVGHLNIGGALHPVLMRDGRVMWSSFESQGYRHSGMWGLWASYPDGRNWEPLMSAFQPVTAMHFAAESTTGTVAVTGYYFNNNSGFGTLFGFPSKPPESLAPLAPFGPPDPAKNVIVRMRYAGGLFPFQFGFSPQGLVPLTPSSNHIDEAAQIDPDNPTQRTGKYTHPSVAPSGDLLSIYTPGPANDINRPVSLPRYQGKIVLLKGGKASKPSEHVVVKEDAAYNYQQPKAVLSWQEMYGQPPVEIPWLPNDGSVHPLLPAGTPYGLIGTSSFYKRDSANFTPSGLGIWTTQGSDSGTYSNSEIHAVRILVTRPQTNLRYPQKDGQVIAADKNWTNPINERMDILAEIPLRKADGVLDPDGNPDTSFMARIPADLAFTFQTLDKFGHVLNMAQSWHQLRPGEIRRDCGGCHAHSQQGTDFDKTAAAKPDYSILTFDKQRDVEFDRDVWPILDAKCKSCHTSIHPSLDLSTPDKAYAALVPSRVMAMRPRESKLLWKLWGKKIDGSNGAIDGGQMPLGGEPLSVAELRTIGDWVGVGASRGVGVFADDLRPILTVAHPRINEAAKFIKVGAIDSGSGIKPDSLKVTLNGSVVTGLVESGHIWTATVDEVQSGTLTAEVSDNAGNITRVVRTFNGTQPVPPTCEEQLAVMKADLAKLQARVVALEATGLIKDAEIKKLNDKIEAALKALE